MEYFRALESTHYFDNLKLAPPVTRFVEATRVRASTSVKMKKIASEYHKKSKKVVLIDWKTSEKKKSTLAKTFDAPLQVAAYVGALNHDSRYVKKNGFKLGGVHKLCLQDEVGRWFKNVHFLSTFMPKNTAD